MEPISGEERDNQPESVDADAGSVDRSVEDLREIAAVQAEKQATPEVIENGDAFLTKRSNAAMTVLHHLTHLPEKRDKYDSNAGERALNAILKTMGVVVGAFAIKYGITADQVPVAGEAILAGTSGLLLAASILQGKIVDDDTRALRPDGREAEGQA